MSRFSVTLLRAEIAKINGLLTDAGILTRLECGGRNGYQAVDEYSVDSDGNRIGSGVNKNVVCGTSRECSDSAHTYWNNTWAANERALSADKVEFGDALLRLLDDDCVGIEVLRRAASIFNHKGRL